MAAYRPKSKTDVESDHKKLLKYLNGAKIEPKDPSKSLEEENWMVTGLTKDGLDTEGWSNKSHDISDIIRSNDNDDFRKKVAKAFEVFNLNDADRTNLRSKLMALLQIVSKAFKLAKT